jgi:hypothetical protein
VGSSEGRGRRDGLLPSVIVLSFRQWKRGKGMMFLHPQTAGFLYSESRNIFEVRLPWMTDHEQFLPLLTDEVPRMTDPEGFLLLMIGSEGFVLAEGFVPLLAEQV